MGALGGVLVVLFITVLAGGIAYVGDRVGHVIGRRRLSLFGLRPRHTSTIFAIGTGMLIALTVTVFAIAVSSYVQTAFFRIGLLNDRINTLEAEAKVLDSHTHDENVVINRGDLVYGAALILHPTQSPAERSRVLSAFFEDTIHYVNQAYGLRALGLRSLKPYTANERDPAISAKLHEVLIDVEPKLMTIPVLVLAVADRNLFPHDEIHFRLLGLADRRIFSAHEPIAALPLAGKNINPQLVMNQLASAASAQAIAHGLPFYFATPLLAMDTARLRTITEEINKTDGAVLVVRAATDIYPHLGTLPIDFELVKQSRQP